MVGSATSVLVTTSKALGNNLDRKSAWATGHVLTMAVQIIQRRVFIKRNGIGESAGGDPAGAANSTILHVAGKCGESLKRKR